MKKERQLVKSKSKPWWKSTYKATDSTSCIAALQSLINDKTGKFEWSKHLDTKEVGFVYDMVSQANCFANFSPSASDKSEPDPPLPWSAHPSKTKVATLISMICLNTMKSPYTEYQSN